MSAEGNEQDIEADQTTDPWENILLGNKELFRQLTEPHVAALTSAAGQALGRERAKGNLLDKLLPEELVGATLLQAWMRRYNRREHQDVKDWLLSVQRWSLQQIILKEKEWKRLTAVSLEAPIEPKLPDKHEDEDYLAQASIPDRWCDVIADDK
ncbi:MAG: hypothetical protein M3N08_07700 [Pseudomonadota bacterium]|nr:hypothetical protein [Pseudomonadota bacterium]